MKAADAEARLLTLEGAGHGFGGKDPVQPDKATPPFFDRHLKK